MKILVVGAGGHAKVVVDAAQASGLVVAGVLGVPGDPDSVCGVPVSHDSSSVDSDGFIVAVGDNASRARMFAELVSAGHTPITVIHPSATVAHSATIGAGSFLAAGVVVNPEARVGIDTILNTACTVDHDCLVSDHAHLGPNVSLCGGVTVGEGALLGVGSCAIGRTTIGAWSIVGAGAAVTGDLAAGMVCVGVPARAIRPVESRP